MIRYLIVVLAACSSNHATVGDAAVARDGLSCVPTSTCSTGPICGATCCGSGEACIEGACMCGTQPACTGGDVCGGVAMADRCGELCCGVTRECPGVAP